MWIAQAANVWNGPHGSTELWVKIIGALVVGFGIMAAMMFAPARARRPIVVTVTFLAGLFYVLFYLWPTPVDRDPGELPRDALEGVGFWLADALPVVVSFTNILTGFLLGLGIYSLLRIHGRRLFKMQKDWGFSLVLILSLVLIVIYGYADWNTRQGPAGATMELRENWGHVNYGRDFLFDGLLQTMDAGMFSIIAFYILSAAYRAFRIRSIEATILLATALIVMLSLMTAVEYFWGEGVNAIAGSDPNGFGQNLTLTAIARWLQDTVQGSSIRAVKLGIGIGALAMGLRLWLSLERTGGPT